MLDMLEKQKKKKTDQYKINIYLDKKKYFRTRKEASSLILFRLI